MKYELKFKKNGWEDTREFKSEEDAREYVIDLRDYSREHGESIEILGIFEI